MRSAFFCYQKSTGILISTLYLSADEASYRNDITTIEPPAETIEQMAVFDELSGEWFLTNRPPPPELPV